MVRRLVYVPFEAHQLDTVTAKIHAAREKSREKTKNMTLSQKSLAGPGYIILNCIRVMNIIGLLAVVTASVVMLVKTSVASKFFFFDAVGHVLTALTGSESPAFRSWYYTEADFGSVSPGLGALTLPVLLRSQLAPAKSRSRLRHTRHGYACHRYQHAWQSQQDGYQPAVSRSRLLAHRHRVRHRHLCARLPQLDCGKSSLISFARP